MALDPEGPKTAVSSRGATRFAIREENKRLATEASYARSRRAKATLAERVDKAKERLAQVNAGGAIQVIQSVSSQDYDVYLLAEEFGQARRGVLKQFGNGRATVRQQYLDEIAEEAPEVPTGEQGE
jgi:hypothetical protein